MRLVRLKSLGFACLPPGLRFNFAPQGLIILAGDNEAGKSTLVHAILAALYGEPASARKKDKTVFNDRETFIEGFTPWHMEGTSAGLILEMLSKDNKPLAIERRFGSSKSKSALRVTDMETGQDITPLFETAQSKFAVGEKLLGMSRPCFEQSGLLLQNSLQQFEHDPDLIQAIEGIVLSSSSGTGAQRAMERLEAAERQRNPLHESTTIVNIDFIIKRLQEKMDLAVQKQTALEDIYREYRQDFEAVDTLSAQQDQLKIQTAQAETRVAMVEYLEIKSRLSQQQSLRDKLAECDRQLAGLLPYEHFPAADAEMMEKLYSRWQQYRDELTRKEAERVALEQKHLALGNELDALGWHPEKTDVDSIVDAVGLLEAAQASYRDAYDEYETTKDQLESLGKDPGRFERLHRQMGTLEPSHATRLNPLIALRENLSYRKTQLNEELKRCSKELDTSVIMSEKRFKWGIMLIGGGFVLIVLGKILPFLDFITQGLGGMVVLGGFILATMAKTDDHLSYLRRETQRMEMELQKVHQASVDFDFQWQTWVSQVREMYPWLDAPTSLDDIQWYMEQRRTDVAADAEILGALNLRMQDLTKREKAVAFALRLTDKPEKAIPQADLDRAVEAFKRKLPDFKTFRRQTDELKQKTDDLTCLRNQQDMTATELHNGLKKAEMEAFQTLDDGVALYRQGVANHKAFVEIRSDRERVLVQLGSDPELVLLAEQAAKMEAFDTADIPENPQSVLEERNHWRTLSTQYEQVRNELLNIRQSVQKKQDEYHRDYAQNQDVLLEYQQMLNRYESYRKALSIARETLSQVAQTEYGQWSERLNRHVNSYLDAFQCEYRKLRFDPNLDFVLQDKEGRDYRHSGRFLRISHGARDQVYLAVRLAITDIFGQSAGYLPLILDDPFVHLDDERFEKAFQALVKLGASGRQILLFTCHTHRHHAAFSRINPNDASYVHWRPLEKIHEKLVLTGDHGGMI